MKNLLATIVAALVAVSFAGIVSAAETQLPAGHPPIAKTEKAPAKKAKKAKKPKKAAEGDKKAVTPASTTAPATTPAAK
jgi:hypothetical protein